MNLADLMNKGKQPQEAKPKERHGFGILLKTMGIDPDQLIDMLRQEMGPQVEEYGSQFIERLRVEITQPLMAKLDSMDEAIKKLDPNYVPAGFLSGEMLVAGNDEPVLLTNEDLPNGGPVNNEDLDPVKLASMAGVGAETSQTFRDPVTDKPEETPAIEQAVDSAEGLPPQEPPAPPSPPEEIVPDPEAQTEAQSNG